MNQAKVWHCTNQGHWINQGLLKELKIRQSKKNQGIFHQPVYLIKVPK